ncbi:DNA-directed RNA polymerase subunit RPC12/RpoP [Bradyrhizobium embrapense]
MESISIARHKACPQCGSALVHLEWHERVGSREVQYLWRCWNCRNEFVTVVNSDEKDPPVAEITKLFFTSLLV